MPTVQAITFEEIIKGRAATVRVTDDGMIFAVDLVMAITGKNRNDAGAVLRGLSDDIFSSAKFAERKIPGKGNAKTKLISLPNAIQLVMVLPGKFAKELRSQFADVLTRYMAGDKSLICEIEANEESDSPVAVLARASLESDDAVDITRKRKLEDMQIAKMESELRAQEIETQAKILDNQMKSLEFQKSVMDTYKVLCPGEKMDDRARLMFKDNMFNLANTGAKAITNGEDMRPTSISLVASELGYKANTKQLISAGTKVAKAYFQRYGEAPPKHEQLVDGRVTKVNSYTAQDKDLIIEALQETLGEP